jgi:hypothetical protein
MRATVVLCCILLGGCSVTVPVAVISKNGQVLRGSTTASLLEGGTFQATDGKLTCSGTYDINSGSLTVNGKVLCNDGRTGFVMATRERGGQAGSGRVRLNDGTEADFVFGNAATAF